MAVGDTMENLGSFNRSLQGDLLVRERETGIPRKIGFEDLVLNEQNASWYGDIVQGDSTQNPTFLKIGYIGASTLDGETVIRPFTIDALISIVRGGVVYSVISSLKFTGITSSDAISSINSDRKLLNSKFVEFTYIEKGFGNGSFTWRMKDNNTINLYRGFDLYVGLDTQFYGDYKIKIDLKYNGEAGIVLGFVGGGQDSVGTHLISGRTNGNYTRPIFKRDAGFESCSFAIDIGQSSLPSSPDSSTIYFL